MSASNLLHIITARLDGVGIIQGVEDLLSPIAQARIFSDRLSAAGIPVSSYPVEHTGFGFIAVGGDTEPSRDEIIRRDAESFDRG